MGLTVDWAVADPGRLGSRLASRLGLPRPDPDADEVVYPLPGGTLRLAREDPRERRPMRATTASDPAALGSGLADPGIRLAGVGWATVELDRAVREAGAALGIDPAAFEAAEDDGWLGAWSRIAPVAGSAVILLEPSTEGRIAAALARHGEGPVCVWLASPRRGSGATRRGPLGPAELVVGDHPWGPFLLGLVEVGQAGTIHP